MDYADYEGEIHAVKYLPKGSVENEGSLYCWGEKGEKIYGIYFVYLNFYLCV